MSCAEVMYQPYQPYFPYQRPHMPPHNTPHATATATVTATAASSDLIPIAPYDVKAYASGFQNWRGLSHMNTSHLPEGLFPLENLKHKFGVPKLTESIEHGSPDFVMANGMLNSPMNLAGNNNSSGRSTSVSSSSRAANSSTASAASNTSNEMIETRGGGGGGGGSSLTLGGDTRSLAVNTPVVRVNNSSVDLSSRVSSSSVPTASAAVAGAGGRVNSGLLQGGTKSTCAAASASSSTTAVSADTVKSEVLHATDAQYISANCVLFTYYSGDISTVVDEHFSRALSCANQSKGFVSKDNSPMAQRNFPPSFWNSHYVYQGGTGMSLASLGAATHGHIHSHGPHPHELSYNADPYHHATTTLHHGIHQSDPWHYPTLSSQSPYSHPAHRPMHHDLAAYNGMTGQSGFTPQYGSLLLQPPSVRSSRLGPSQCSSLSKPTDAAAHWQSAAQRYHEHLTGSDISSHLEAANYGGGYTSMCSMPEVEARGFFQTHEGYN